jgi:hypothetical protein
MPLVAICKITSNLLFVDFDISHMKPDFKAGFLIFQTFISGVCWMIATRINKKGQTEFDLSFYTI